jgi:hypothetical protein
MLPPIYNGFGARAYPETDLSEMNLNWIIKEVKNLMDRTKALEDIISSLDILTPEEIQAKIEENLNEYDSIIKEYIRLRDSEILTQSKNYTDDEISKVKMLIESKINETIEIAQAYTDSVKEILEGEIEEKIVDYSFMISPFSGEEEEISSVIYQMIDTFHKALSITVSEFDSKALTVDEFDALNVSAFNFDFYAKNYIN